MEELRRERAQLTGDQAVEPSDESYRYPRSRNFLPYVKIAPDITGQLGEGRNIRFDDGQERLRPLV